MFFEIVGTIIAFLLLWFALDYDFSQKQPPGPLRLPIVGTLLQQKLESSIPYIALHKLSKKYGDVMRVRLGLVDTVIVSSFESIKEIFSLEETSGRSSDAFILFRNRNKNLGLVFGEGKSWHQLRKFSLKTLKDFGFGKRDSMEHLILEEVNQCIEVFARKLESKEFQDQKNIEKFENNFSLPFLNLILSLIKGERYAHNDKDFLKVAITLKTMAVVGSSFGTGRLTCFPFLAKWFPKSTGMDILLEKLEELRIYCSEFLQSRRAVGVYKENPECFTDIFLQKMEDGSENTDNEIYTEEQFQVICMDLIQAAVGTSSSFVMSTVKFLACNPEAQNKMYAEISKIMEDTGAPPTLADKDRMPYTQAVTLEVHRRAKIVVNSVPRRAIKDFHYKNYLIKKGTMLLWNFHSIFMDKDFWKDPEVFRPERFLTETGEIDKIKADRIIPFGVGRRICFGDFFAKDSSFIFITALIRSFSFKLPPGVTSLDLEPAVGLSLYPKPFNAVIELRNTK